VGRVQRKNGKKRGGEEQKSARVTGVEGGGDELQIGTKESGGLMGRFRQGESDVRGEKSRTMISATGNKELWLGTGGIGEKSTHTEKE